jgi:hypothetical protein
LGYISQNLSLPSTPRLIVILNVRGSIKRVANSQITMRSSTGSSGKRVNVWLGSCEDLEGKANGAPSSRVLPLEFIFESEVSDSGRATGFRC